MNKDWNNVLPQYRTCTVTSLCEKMLTDNDYSILPILADALEDADCRDRELLEFCRNHKIVTSPDRILAQRVLNILCSEERAKAVKWIDRFAENIGYDYDYDEPPMYTYESIIRAGHTAVENGSYCWGTDAGADHTRGDREKRKFFDNWSLITGIKVPDEKMEEIYFRCAC